MKITAGQLRKIINEEVQKLMLEYEQSVIRRGDTLYLVDDEGNEDELGDVADYPEYKHVRPGYGEPYVGGGGGGRSYGSYGSRRRRWR